LKKEGRSFLIDAKAGFSDGQIKLPKGVIQGQKLNLVLRRLTQDVDKINDFDELPIPFRAVATDLETGQAVTLEKGSLATAMRASMSIPGALQPVEIDGKLLVDGGVADNLPMDVARRMGADRLIVVSIGTPLSPAAELKSVVDVTSQLTTIMTMQNTQRSLATLTDDDILIQPDLDDIATADFLRMNEAIKQGRQGAELNKDRLMKLAIDADGYRRPALAQKTTANDIIDFIEIDNNSKLSDDIIRARLTVKPGDPFNHQQLQDDVNRIYGMDLFQQIDYERIEKDGRHGVVIHARAKDWGPDFLQFGLEIEDNLDGDSNYNFGIGYTRTAINRLGGEWRSELRLGTSPLVMTRFFQPLDLNSRYFIEPEIIWQRYNIGVYDDKNQLSQLRVESAGFSLSAGIQLDTWGEFRTGLQRTWDDSEVRIGNPDDISSGSYDRGAYFVTFSTDTLDNINFPHYGHTSYLAYMGSRNWLGGDDDNYDMFELAAVQPWTVGRHTWIGGFRMGATADGEPIPTDRFTLGGLFNLSGYAQRQISGKYSGLADVLYYYRLDNLNAMLSIPSYIGGSIELGNVWDEQSDITAASLIPAGSLFLGFDTFVGPIYLAGGMAEGGQYSLYLFLGTIY